MKAFVIAVLLLAGPDESVKKYLRPGLKLPEASYYPPKTNPKPIRATQAVRYAVEALKRRRVRDIRICQFAWIVAPLGGALVDATGVQDLAGARYTTFRVGVRDGTEAKYGYRAGEEFMFIARGLNRAGEVVWQPTPGPDSDEVKNGFVGDYEFLAVIGEYKFLDRKSFENLAESCK